MLSPTTEAETSSPSGDLSPIAQRTEQAFARAIAEAGNGGERQIKVLQMMLHNVLAKRDDAEIVEVLRRFQDAIDEILVGPAEPAA